MGNIPGTGIPAGPRGMCFFPVGPHGRKTSRATKWVPVERPTVSRGVYHRPPRDTMVMPWVPTGSPVGTWEKNTILMLHQGYKLSPNWTGPYEVLAVGPCSSADTPPGHDPRWLDATLLLLILLSDGGCAWLAELPTCVAVPTKKLF